MVDWTVIDRLLTRSGKLLEPLLPVQRKGRYCLRQMFDAMRHIYRTGCQWRNLPACFPP